MTFAGDSSTEYSLGLCFRLKTTVGLLVGRKRIFLTLFKTSFAPPVVKNAFIL
jgi:hypothetical protein